MPSSSSTTSTVPPRDGAATGCAAPRSSGRRALGGNSTRTQRALPDFARRRRSRPVRLHDAEHRRHAEPATGELGAEERFEDARVGGGVHAAAVVAHAELDDVARRDVGVAERAREFLARIRRTRRSRRRCARPRRPAPPMRSARGSGAPGACALASASMAGSSALPLEDECAALRTDARSRSAIDAHQPGEIERRRGEADDLPA